MSDEDPILGANPCTCGARPGWKLAAFVNSFIGGIGCERHGTRCGLCVRNPDGTLKIFTDPYQAIAEWNALVGEHKEDQR